MSTHAGELIPYSDAFDDGFHLPPESEGQARRLAQTPGNHLPTLDEGIRADIRARQGGRRVAAERKREFAYGRKRAEEVKLREARARLKHIEPTVVAREKRADVGVIGWFLIILLLGGLLLVLYNENGAAAQALLATAAFDVTTIMQARMVMLTPVAVGIAFILGFKALPPYVRRPAFLAACASLAIAFSSWAFCFAIQTEKFRDEATQPIRVAVAGSDGAITSSESGHAGQSWPAWLMFGSLSIIMALTTFIGHAGVEQNLAKYDTWAPNPDHTRARDDVQIYENEVRVVNNEIVASEKELAGLVADEDRAVTQARALYISLKQQCAKVSAVAALVSIFLAGCQGESVGGGVTSNPGHLTPITRVIAISPLLPAAEKAIVGEQLNAELAWIANEAPVGSVTWVVDALECAPIARLEALAGASRIRKKSLMQQALAAQRFLATSHPKEKDDGRVHLPRLAQTVKQWGLPSPSHIVVLGNPLFLNEGRDRFFSMTGGRVPSDGCLAEEQKLNIYSVQGREKALSGQYWHLGWSGEVGFEDDTHRQAVLRFWSLYLQGQSARLVTAQSSFVAALEAARDSTIDPLMYADPDATVPPAMVRIIKVQREVKTEIRLEPREEDKVNVERVRESNDAAEEVSLQEYATANTQVEKDIRNELAHRDRIGPEEARDEHGNAPGSNNDLIANGQMAGQKILMATLFRDADVETSPLAAALAAKGFSVQELNYPFPNLPEFEEILESAQQFWLWSSADNRLPTKHLLAIVERWKAGKLALCLLADNSPYTSEAAAVLAAIAPGSSIGGDYAGEHNLSARVHGGGGFSADSPLFHNIRTLFEGATVSTVTGPGLVPVCYATNGAPLIATLQRQGTSRLVVHCGFTSFYKRFWDDAGISRFAVNCAGWLNGADSKDTGVLREPNGTTASGK